MNNHPSIRHQIDTICERYKQQLDRGENPDSESFVREISPEFSAQLRNRIEQLTCDYRSPIDATLDSSPSGWTAQVAPDSAQTLDGSAQSDTADATKVSTGRGKRIKSVGDYEIIDEIARGGMGVVYRARQTSLGRLVALKMILSGELADDREVARFQSEAEAAANLNHPGIVPIYEVGQQADQRYFSMALIEGESLSEVLRDGPIQPSRAVELVRQVAEAIHYAHEHGVIHRDLKPGNILLDQQGRPHVTDFGLAKRLSGSEELTTTGQVIGTPAYMPPEQAQGDLGRIGPASDLYSLGAILYAALSGRPPHVAGSAIDTLRQVIETEPLSVRSLNPTIPKDLATICETCLAKEPSRRFASAAELADELGRFQRGEPIHARPVSAMERCWRRAKRHPVPAALSAAVLLLTAALAIGGPLAAMAQARLKQLAQTNEQRANQLARSERESREQAEASQLALAAEKERTDHALYARTVSLAYQQWLSGNLTSAEDSLASLPLALRGFEWDYVDGLCHSELDQFGGMDGMPTRVALSADGIHVIASRPGRDPKCYLWKLGQNQPLEVRSQAVLAISTDGATLIASNMNTGELQVVDAVTGEVRNAFGDHKNVSSFASLGGGDDAVFAAVCTDRTVRVWDTKLGEEIAKIDEPHRRRLHPIALSHNGRHLVWRRADDGAIEVRDVERGYRRFEGPATQRMAGVSAPVAFAPDDQTFAVGGYGEVELRRTIDGERLGRLDGLRGKAIAIAYSPEGDRIAVTCEDGTIRIFDAFDKRLLTQLNGHKIGMIYGITSVAFDSSGDRVISGGADGIVKVWDAWSGDRASIAGTGRPLAEMPRPSQTVDYLTNFSNSVEGVTVTADGSMLLASGRDHSVRVFDAASGNLVREWTQLKQNFGSVDFDEKKQIVVAGGGSISDRDPGPVIAWDYRTGEQLWRFDETSGPISRVKFFAGGSKVAVSVGSQNTSLGGLFALDAASGEVIWKSETALQSIRDMAVANDDSSIVTVGAAPGVTLTDAATGKFQGSTRGKTFYCVALSENGKHVAAGSADWQVVLFDRETGDPVWKRLRHSGAVTGVAFTANDSRLVSTGFDGTTRIWDTRFGDLILTLEDDDEEKYAIAASASGKLIASVGQASNVIVRRVASDFDRRGDDDWVTLLEDDFERDQIGDSWDTLTGQWKLADGVLMAELRPSENAPGLNAALLVGKFFVPANVEIAYDVQIDSPMIVESKLTDKHGKNAVMAEHIGISSSPFNHGEKGISLMTTSRGNYSEVASRRGGGFAFETGRTYRFRTRRIGRRLEAYVDGELYRAAELPMETPVPKLMLQALFGQSGDRFRLDNVVIKAPEGSEVEICAAALVTGLFETHHLKPLVTSELHQMDPGELAMRLESGLASELAMGLDAAVFGKISAGDLRQTAIRLAENWPQEKSLVIQRTMDLATAGTLDEQAYAALHDWIIVQTPLKTEGINRAAALAAYRAGLIGDAWESLKQASQNHVAAHGTKHPVDLAMEALLLQKGGNTEQAGNRRRELEQLMLAEHWQREQFASEWAALARDSVQLPPSDTVATLLSQRIWDIEYARQIRGDLQPLADALAPEARIVWRRGGDGESYLHKIDRDTLLATEELWNIGGRIGTRLTRSSAQIQSGEADVQVTSRFTVEFGKQEFFTWLQFNTFQRNETLPPQQWTVTNWGNQLTGVSFRGQRYSVERDGWEPIDRMLQEAKDGGNVGEQIGYLLLGQRPQEAVEVAKVLAGKHRSAESFAMLAEAAYQARDLELMRKAADKAVELDTMVRGPLFLRKLACEKHAAHEAIQLSNGIIAHPPTFYPMAPLSLLAVGDRGLAAWQPTSSSLVGILTVPLDGAINEMVDAMIKIRESSLNCELLTDGHREVDGQRVREFVQRGMGIGRAMALQGEPTIQRFVVVEHNQEAVVIFVSAFAEEFDRRDAEFQQFVRTIGLTVPTVSDQKQ